MINLAPIVLFTYNRLSHTHKTLEALKQNLLASQSQLIIYSDGYKNQNDKESVLEIRDYLKTITGFAKITIIEQDKNKGLASSIIDGITQTIKKYKKVIALEDDLVTSPYFLKYMNDALNYYEKEKKVWHISGWNYPIKSKAKVDTFSWRMMNCWGWATWEDRWKHFEKEPQDLISKYSKYDIYKFDLDGIGGFWNQVVKNSYNKMNTWAIFWYASIFNNNGLCINPKQSFVHNIGFDGSGTNTDFRENYQSSLNQTENVIFTDYIEEDSIVVENIKRFLLKNNTYYHFILNYEIIYIKLEEILNSKNKIILYGAGTLCKLLLPYIKDRVSLVLDKNSIDKNRSIQDIQIIPLNEFTYLNKEKIVITVLGKEEEIKKELLTSYKNLNPKDIIQLKLF